VSSVLPYYFAPEDSIAGNEQFSGDGDACSFFGVSCGEEALIDIFQDRVVSAGDEGSPFGGFRTGI
jgi:hypothetical protein